jgi:hypothetical protein
MVIFYIILNHPFYLLPFFQDIAKETITPINIGGYMVILKRPGKKTRRLEVH